MPIGANPLASVGNALPTERYYRRLPVQDYAQRGDAFIRGKPQSGPPLRAQVFATGLP